MIKFTYYGDIKGKGRPRFRSTGKFVQTYTDDKTHNYECSLKEAYLVARQESYMDSSIPLRANIQIYHQIPKSVSKKKRVEMLDGKEFPVKKPDVDNILKSIFDSLNKVAFADDTQIVEVTASKHYAEMPRIDIEIEELKWYAIKQEIQYFVILDWQ